MLADEWRSIPMNNPRNMKIKVIMGPLGDSLSLRPVVIASYRQELAVVKHE
jgi:hypothetical protein